MWHDAWGHGGWGMGFGFIPMLLFWVLMITAVVLLLKYLFRQLSSVQRDEAAQDIAIKLLRERYARGEIDQQEFEQRLSVLKAPPGCSNP